MKSKYKVRYIKNENGDIAYVSLSVQDFDKLIDELADLHDLNIVYKRLQKKTKLIPMEDIGRKLFGYGKKK